MSIRSIKNETIIRTVILAVLFFTLGSKPAISETFSATIQPGWRMLSVPVNPTSQMNACAIFGADRTYSVEGQSYATCSSAIYMTPGKGVLVYLDSPYTFNVDGRELQPSESVTVKLKPGWNEIGTPATYSISAEQSLYIDGVPISAASTVRPGLYGYDPVTKKYFQTFYMYPWEGYLIYANRSADLRIVPVAGEGAPGPAVTLDIMNGPGAGAARVSSLDLSASDAATLWAAGYDSHNRFTGNVPVNWTVNGALGAAGGSSDHIDLSPAAPGASGSVTATSGNLAPRSVSVVVFGSGENYTYPFNDKTPTAVDAATGLEYISNQALVAFGAGVSESQARFIIESGGGTVAGRNAAAGTYQVKIPEGADPSEYIATLVASGQTLAAGLNYILSDASYPSDPVFQTPSQASRKWYIDKTGVNNAWDSAASNYAPVVAVVDTGVDSTHPELSSIVLEGINFVDPSQPTDVSDESGHGTAAAGIIAAARNNGVGGAGICENCSILPVKVCDGAGRCPVFQVVAGIAYAADNGADIINLSIGAALPESDPARTILQAAITDASAKGALIVAAAGNLSSDAAGFAPASLNGVIAVGATNENDERASFSNFGATVDIAAPGLNIYAPMPSSQFGDMQGTSMSAAVVSGIAGLMKSSGKISTPENLADILISSSRSIVTDEPIGGLVDAEAAINNILSSNFPPAISAISIPGATGAAGSTISVSITASDPDGDDMTIAWNADGGTIANGTTLNASWTLPDTAGIYGINVTVTDSVGASASRSAYILVMNGALSAISVTPAVHTMRTGETVQLSALCKDDSFGSAGVECPVTWSSTISSGTVSSDGLFTALGSGASVVTASLDGVSGSAIIYVEYDPGAILYPAADMTPCGTNWLFPNCNTANTGESTLKLTPPLTAKASILPPTVGAIEANPIVYNGVLYMGDDDGKLHAIDIATFANLPGWPMVFNEGVTTKIFPSTPIFDASKQYLYIASNEGYIYKIEISTASVVWKWTPDSTKIYAFQSSPYLDGNILYFTSSKDNASPLGRIFAITDNGNSASFLWAYPDMASAPVKEFSDASAVVVTAGGTKMVASSNTGGKIYAVDALAGTMIHTFSLTAQNCAQTPVVNGIYIYVACDIDGLMKYDLTPGTGGLIWKDPISGIRTPPAYKNGQLFVGSVNTAKAYAIRDNGNTYAEDIWPAPADLESNKPYAHPTIYPGGGVNGNNQATVDGIIFPTFGPLYILSLADGSIIDKRSFGGNKQGNAIPVQVGPDPELIIPTHSGLYLYEKNFAPTITSIVMSESPVNGSPMMPGGVSSAYATVVVNDQNGLDDINKVYIDLTPIGGSSSANLTTLAVPGEYYTKSGGTTYVSIVIPKGVPEGPLNFTFYVEDKGGFSSSGQSSIDIGEAPPTIVSASFSADLYNDGIDTVTVNVTVKDDNIVAGELNDDPVVRVDLDPVLDNNSVPDWITLTCGNGYVSSGQKMDCSSSAIVSSYGKTPGVYSIMVEAYDTANTATSSAPLTVIGVSKFNLVAAPSAPDTGAATTITVTADNKYGQIANYNNAAALNITMTGGTAAALTYSGAGITDNNDGTATIAANSFSGGSYQFNVTNTKDDSGVKFTITDVFGANGTSNSVQWVPRTLGYFDVVWNYAELVKGDNATVLITARDPYSNLFTGYQNPNGLLISHKSGATSAADLIYDEASGVLTDNLDGTADFASGAATFASGLSSFKVTNRNADPSVVFTVAEKLSAAKGDSNGIAWELGFLGSFTFSQIDPVLPGNPVTGASATIRITAYDNTPFTEILTSYNNAQNLTISKTGGTASAIHWSGPGVVDNNDGTATILGTNNGGGVFSNGILEIQVSDTVAETPTFTLREYDRNPNITKATSVTWKPGSIAYFNISLGVANPSMIVGDTASLTITAKDQFGNTSVAYGNTSGVTLAQSMGAAGTGVVWKGTDVQFSNASNPPNYNDLIIGNGTAFNNGVATVQIKNTVVSYGVTVTVTDIASSKFGTSVALDWKPGALGSFVVSAAPTSLVAGATSTVTVTAYDIFGNLKTDFNSNVTMSTNGTASGITWSGVNVTPLTSGTGRINAAGFSSGEASAIIRNTVAQGPVIITATSGSVSSPSLVSVSPTWVPGPLNSIIVRNAANNAGSPIGNVTMKSTDTLNAWAAGYDQYNNYISDINSDWTTTDTLDLSTSFNANSFVFSPSTVQTSGKISATENGGSIFDETGTISVLSAEPKPPVLSAANGVDKVVLTWVAPTLSIDNLPINSADLYYVLYRSTTPGGPYVDPPLVTTANAVTVYNDTSGSRWITYYYKVKAVNSTSSLESVLSNEASASPIAEAFSKVKYCGLRDPDVYHPADWPGYLNRPGDVKIDSGIVYVADTDNHRIETYLESDCSFLATIGSYGITDGTLRYPSGLTFHSGSIYTVDDYGRLSQFDLAGNSINTYTTANLPHMVASDGTNLFVTSSNNLVYKVNPSNGSVYATQSFSVNSPYGVAYNPVNNLYYVSDSTLNRIRIYDSSGAPAGTIGSTGSGFGQFSSPRGIAIDSSGYIYVADSGNNRIQIFNTSGALVNTICGSASCISSPYGVTVSPATGNVWVADRMNQRVVEFEYTGPPM